MKNPRRFSTENTGAVENTDRKDAAHERDIDDSGDADRESGGFLAARGAGAGGDGFYRGRGHAGDAPPAQPFRDQKAAGQLL